jgi:hypothetical protein
MKNLIKHHYLAFASILLLAGFAIGCTTVVAPISSAEVTMTDENHGFLFGTIHLTRKDKDQSAGLKWPKDMKWLITDETRGKRFLITPLPIDGSYVVKLPAGSYRLTDVSFNSIRGTWHTSLPATFTLRPQECTSLGTWELQLQTAFVGGWLSRKVVNEQESAPDTLKRLFVEKDCPISVVSLEPYVKTAAKLRLLARGEDSPIPRDSR